jgi:hypothetical protein
MAHDTTKRADSTPPPACPSRLRRSPTGSGRGPRALGLRQAGKISTRRREKARRTQRGRWPHPNQSGVQRRHAPAGSGNRCAKRHCPACSAISASSAISALILPHTERLHVRPPQPTPRRPGRTARAAGSTALTQRSQRAQRSQRRQHDGLSRRAHDRHSSYSPGRIPCRRPPGIALLMPRKPCVGT